jgi:hypothetical protein
MTGISASVLQLNFAQGQIQIIMDDDQMVLCLEIALHQTGNRAPTSIHIRLGLGEQNRTGPQPTLSTLGLCLMRTQQNVISRGERINHIKSEIMPGTRIARSGIAQPNDDIHVRVPAPDCG